MVAEKKQTKKDLENKIAELEAKLNKLSTELETPAETKPAETKPAETKPAEAPNQKKDQLQPQNQKVHYQKDLRQNQQKLNPLKLQNQKKDQPQPQNQKVHYQKDLRQNQQKLNPPKLPNHLKHKHNHQQPLLKHWRTHTMMHQ